MTSRDALAGLVAGDGARRVGLDLLPADEAVGLLQMLIRDRVDADPRAAGCLAVQCCRLPLALRAAAELAAARPAVPLAELAEELADYQRPAGGTLSAMSCWQYAQLTIIPGGDPPQKPRTVLWQGPGQGLGANFSDSNQTVPELLNRFGADGWELVSHQDHSGGGTELTARSYWEEEAWSLSTYTFKRPVTE